MSAFAGLLERFSPPPPLPLLSYFAWGDPDEVERRFARFAGPIRVERRTGSFAFEGTEDALAFWRRTNAAVLALERLLPAERHAELLRQAARLLDDLLEREAGRIVARFDYLEVLARTRPSRGTSSAGST